MSSGVVVVVVKYKIHAERLRRKRDITKKEEKKGEDRGEWGYSPWTLRFSPREEDPSSSFSSARSPTF